LTAPLAGGGGFAGGSSCGNAILIFHLQSTLCIDSTESKSGFTALHFAVQNGNVGAARILWKSSGMSVVKNFKGATAKDMAIALDNKAIITLLESYDIQVGRANVADLAGKNRKVHDSGNFSNENFQQSIKSLTDVFGSSFTLCVSLYHIYLLGHFLKLN
jgi:ankyrin repeat protein